MPAGEEAELVRAAQQGDKGAFAALLERHRPMLLAVCGRLLRDRWLAEDAVQEATVQALRSLDRLRRPESFAPWLSAIGLNICRRWLRERRHAWSWEALVGGQIVDGPHAGPEPEDLAEATELAERVRQAVGRLPRRQRAAVVLFYLPIWIGRSEGDSLALGLQHVQPPRPLTYALAANLVRAAGARVREVTVSRLVDTTFYSSVVLEAPEGTKMVDARPSDALNLALATGAPIRVEPAVLEAADRHRSSLPPEKVQGAAEIVTEIMADWSKHTAQPK